MDPLALLVPGGVRYGCVRCGRSCEDWTEVEIDAAAAERLRRLPLFDPRLAPLEEGTLPYGPGVRAEAPIVLRFRGGREGGGTRCVLLDEDGLCAVHLAHGLEAKPVPCRSFPFHFVETPDGTRAGVSFACTAIAHDQGEPIDAQEAEVRAVHAVATHRERRGRGIRIAPGEALRWDEWRSLETRLAEALAGAGDVSLGLLAQARLVRERAGLPALDPRPSSRLRERVLAWLVERAGRPPRFRRPHAGLAAPDPERLLARWVAHRLFRLDLLRGGEILFGHGLLLAEVALARAWAREAEGGMAEAVAEVERGLALHGDVVERIERSPALRAEAGRLFAAPRYAASMTDDGA